MRLIILFKNIHFRLFFGAVVISFSPVFVNIANVAPTTSGFYRVLFGGIALTFFIFLSGKKISFNQSAWVAIFCSAIFFSFDLWFWHRSILYVGPGLATLLANMQVFFMMAAGVLLFKQKPSARQIISIPLAITGLFMVVGIDWSNLPQNYQLGIVFGILTAISYSGYMLCMRQARINSTYSIPMREIAIMSLFVSIFLGSTAIFEGKSLLIPTVIDFSWLLAYGVLSHAVGLVLIASSLARVPTTEVGLALLLQPSLSFLWDILFFNRSTSLVEALGVLIVLFAIFLGFKRNSQQKLLG